MDNALAESVQSRLFVEAGRGDVRQAEQYAAPEVQRVLHLFSLLCGIGSSMAMRDQSSVHRPFSDARHCAADLHIEAQQPPLRFDGKLAPKRLANQAELTEPDLLYGRCSNTSAILGCVPASSFDVNIHGRKRNTVAR
jgi:hypothetical protein